MGFRVEAHWGAALSVPPIGLGYLGLVVLGACSAPVDPPEPGPWLVLDARLGTERPGRALITWGDAPSARVAVAFEFQSELGVYDDQLGERDRVGVGSAPRSLAWMPASAAGPELLISANGNARSLSLVETGGFTRSATIGIEPAPLFVAAQGDTLWVVTGPDARDATIQRWQRSGAGWSPPRVTRVPQATRVVPIRTGAWAVLTASSAVARLDDGLRIGAHHSVCAEPLASRVADVDADGREDLVVACGSGGVDLLLDVEGRAERVHREGGARIYDVAVTDLDRDGRLDLAAADVTQHQVWVWRGAGETVESFGVDRGPIALAALEVGPEARPALAILTFEARAVDLLVVRR